jgi:hypothetical protein
LKTFFCKRSLCRFCRMCYWLCFFLFLLLGVARKIRARICLPPPPRLQNASQILATTRRIVRTNGKEKNRRSGGESECHPGSRGRMALGDGSFQVYFSFVATAGIVFFRTEEFAVRHLQHCVWYCYLQVTRCQRTPEFLDLRASFASARDRISWLLLVWPIRVA